MRKESILVDALQMIEDEVSRSIEGGHLAERGEAEKRARRASTG